MEFFGNKKSKEERAKEKQEKIKQKEEKELQNFMKRFALTGIDERDLKNLRSNKMKMKKPVYKNWWFWVLIVVLFIFMLPSEDNNNAVNTIKETEIETKKETIKETKIETKEETIKETIEETETEIKEDISNTSNTSNSYNYGDERIKAVVTRVVDGDTIVATVNGRSEKIRLIGVNTPESVHPNKSKNTEEGRQASAFTKEQLQGKEVLLEFDVQQRDKYGRLLAYVYLNNKMFNETLLEKGYAKIATYPPNVKYVEKFKAISGVDTEYKQKTKSDNSYETSNSDAKIKGHKKSRIYHLPGQQSYNKIKASNIVWFKSEEEAENAGYRRAKR